MGCRSLTRWFARAPRESVDLVFLIAFGLAGIVVNVVMITALIANATQN